MWKKIQAFIMCAVLMLSLNIGFTAFADGDITVKLNGQALAFDVPPQVINGRTMVPMRAIFEALGASVAWDEATQTVTSVRDETTVKLTIGVPGITVNDVAKELDIAPCITDGRTLVPVRAVSEAFQLHVSWNGATQTVAITTFAIHMDSYNALKEILVKQGKLSDGTYRIFNMPSGGLYGLTLGYKPENDTILLFFQANKNYKNSIMITIYPDKNPTLFHTLTVAANLKYEVYGEFKTENMPYTTILDTYDPDWDSSRLINAQMGLVDTLMQLSVEMSLADFGLYYAA